MEQTFRPATMRERFAALAALGAAVAIVAAIAPVATRPFGPSVALIAALYAATVVMTAVSSMISYNWYLATRSGAYAMLATAYGATTLLVACFALTLPGVTPQAPGSAGGTAASGYLWVLYHAVFVGLLGATLGAEPLFARSERLGESNTLFLRRYVAVVTLAAVVLAVAVSALAPHLPPLVVHDSYGLRLFGILRDAVLGEVVLVAIALVALTRLRRRIDLWIGVTLALVFAEIVLGSSMTSERYTAGWYGAEAVGSAGLVALFVAQFRQIGAVLDALARDRRDLATSAGRDGLTSLLNRRAFDERLQTLWQASRTSHAPLALVMVDIDFFKLYNDRYGHPSGDDALRLVSRALTEALRRPADLCARIGGEEFALILPGTDIGGAFLVAETIRTTLEERRIPHAGGLGGRLTASFGVAASTDRGIETSRALHERSDDALYEAKRLGRNRVFAHRRLPSILTARGRP